MGNGEATEVVLEGTWEVNMIRSETALLAAVCKSPGNTPFIPVGRVRGPERRPERGGMEHGGKI